MSGNTNIVLVMDIFLKINTSNMKSKLLFASSNKIGFLLTDIHYTPNHYKSYCHFFQLFRDYSKRLGIVTARPLPIPS